MTTAFRRLIAVLFLLGVLTGARGGPMPVHRSLAATGCLSADESLLLDRINTQRTFANLGTLTASPTLSAAARHQAESMAEWNYFPDDYSVQHEGPNGDQTTTWQQNIANAGYPDNTHTVRAAIIGSGSKSVTEIARSLAALPAYRDVLIDSRFRAIGIGFATSNAGDTYWTITLGSLADGTLPPCADTPIALAVAGSGRSDNSSSSAAVIDGDLTTTWQTESKTAPANAWVWIDLGSVQLISRIEWMFARTGAADRFAIDVSTDRSNWTQVAMKGNGAANEWRAQNWSGSARYVRFYFANPNDDPVLGYLSEIRVFR